MALLALATILGFWQIALTGRILVGYDLFTYFYPYREAVDRALREGRVPLWNPDIFLGVPMLANIQSAVLYPLNWLTIALPAPQAITVQILLHVALAGVGMYYFCRLSLGIDRLASLVGAFAFMFSGFLSAQVGHPNQLAASAWLPIVLLFYEQACRHKKFPLVLAAGASLATQFLAGHTQESYLTLVTLGLYFGFQLVAGTGRALFMGLPSPIGLLAHLRLTGRMLARWIGELAFTSAAFAAVLAIGGGLAAIQLIPTYELSTQSIRSGGLSFREASSFSLPPNQILRALLPGYLENLFSEYVAYVGILPLGLAMVAVGVRFRRLTTLFMIVLVVAAVFLAAGNFNPFYTYVYKYIPGISLFRVPARWLFLYTFAIATLAAIGASVFSQALPAGRSRLSHLRRTQLGVVLAVVGLFVVVWFLHPLLAFPRVEVLAIWVPMVGLTLALILGGLPWAPNRWIGCAILVVVAVELWVARGDLELSHPVAPGAYTSYRPAVSQLLLDKDRFRILTISEGTFDPGDFNDLRTILRDELTPERIQEYVTASKYNELLTPNVSMHYGIATIDGYDGGVLPLKKYVDFKNVIVDSSEAAAASVAPRPNARQADGILREQLDALPDSGLLGSMNVKYAILDKSRDPWVSNVYYDLGTTVRVSIGQPARITDLPSFSSTSLGLISYLQGAEQVRTGDVVATVSVVASDGSVITDSLRAGFDTAEGDYNRPSLKIAHTLPQKSIASLWKGNPQAYNYHAVIPFKSPLYPKEIRFEVTLPSVQLVLRGASLVDDRTEASESLVLDQRWRLVHSGDLKVYRNLDWRDRVFLTRSVRPVNSDSDALEVLKRSSGRSTAILDGSALSSSTPVRPDDLTVVQYDDERRLLRTRLDQPAYLVVSETFFPGWTASVDNVPVAINRANGLFMSIFVPAGEHEIVLEFAPDSLALGSTITILTAQASAGGLAVWFILLVVVPAIARFSWRVRRNRSAR